MLMKPVQAQWSWPMSLVCLQVSCVNIKTAARLELGTSTVIDVSREVRLDKQLGRRKEGADGDDDGGGDDEGDREEEA